MSYDKYIIIWWDTDLNDIHASLINTYEDTMSFAMAINNGRIIFHGDGQTLDEGHDYSQYSMIVTKYQPILEKDLKNELL